MQKVLELISLAKSDIYNTSLGYFVEKRFTPTPYYYEKYNSSKDQSLIWMADANHT